jgi:hypothetical protein
MPCRRFLIIAPLACFEFAKVAQCNAVTLGEVTKDQIKDRHGAFDACRIRLRRIRSDRQFKRADTITHDRNEFSSRFNSGRSRNLFGGRHVIDPFKTIYRREPFRRRCNHIALYDTKTQRIHPADVR